MPEDKGTHGHVVAFDDLHYTRHAHELRLVAVHGAGRFNTEWLQNVDQTWVSRPRP